MSTHVRYIDEPPHTPPNGRSIGAAINDVKVEFKQFAETRIAMLQSEMKDKIANIKSSAPMLVLGGLLAATGFLVLTAALISVIYVAFRGSPYAVFLSCLIVGAVYAIFGFAALFFGYQNITKHGLTPERTIKVLKDDKVWFQSEARTQL